MTLLNWSRVKEFPTKIPERFFAEFDKFALKKLEPRVTKTILKGEKTLKVDLYYPSLRLTVKVSQLSQNMI
jgi:hypothetical protein